AAIGLLVVRDLHHVHLALQAEEAARLGQRGAPLASAGFRGEAGDFLLLVVVRLRHRRVWLVTAGRADAFVLVVDPRRGIERLLEATGAIERRRAPETIDVAHRFRNLDPALLAHRLLDQLHGKQRREAFGPDGL